MKLDHAPIALGALYCAALVYLGWIAPTLPTGGPTDSFASEFAASSRRLRLVLFPLGVATSTATLIALLRHGRPLSRRGLLQSAGAGLLLASGMLSSLGSEPATKAVADALRAGAATPAIEQMMSRLGVYYLLHLGLAVAALVCVTAATRAPLPAKPASAIAGLDERHRLLLFLLGTATFFQGYDTFIVSMALPYIGRDLGASDGTLGFALSTIRVGAVVSILLGWAADRRGRRGLLLVTVFAYTLATAATGLSRGLTDFVVCQLVAQIFLVAETSIAQVFIAEEFPAKFRAVGQGLLGMFGALGSGMAAMLFPIFQETGLGWRGLYFAGLVPLLLVTYLRRSLPETGRWQAAERRRETDHVPPAELVAADNRRSFLVLVALAVALGASAAPAFGFASYRATNDFGWTPSEVSAMVLLGGGFGIGGWLASGLAAERIGRRPLGVLSFVATGAAIWLFYTGRALGPAFAILVFGEAGCVVALNALGTELFPTRLRASAKSWITNASVVGAVLGMAAVGALSAPPGGASEVIRWLAMLPIICASTLALVPETSGLELEAIEKRDGVGSAAGT